MSNFIQSTKQSSNSKLQSISHLRPNSDFSFKVPSTSSLTRRAGTQEETDDFEAMFLSDITLSSNKTTSNSVITDFKERNAFPPTSKVLRSSIGNNAFDLKPLADGSSDSHSNSDLNRFTESLKEIPLLDMDPNLRKLINEKYSKLKNANADRCTDTFFIFDMFYTKTTRDLRYRFDVRSQFRNYIESFYLNWLPNCPEEVIACLENGVLG